MNDEHILFKAVDSAPVVIYREDIEDLWNVLRLRGTLREEDMPESIRETGAIPWLFDVLTRLDYVRPVELRAAGQDTAGRGLRYVPLPAKTHLEEAEIVV